MNNASLPSWDLTSLYSDFNDPAINDDFNDCDKSANEFVKSYSGRIQSLSSGELHQAIKEYEGIVERLGKLMTYAFLRYATNSNDSETTKFYQMVQERANEITTNLIFFTLDVNKIENDKLAEHYSQSQELQRYKAWFDSVRAFLPHQLSPELEKLMHERALTSNNSWVRLVDETLNAAKFDFQGQSLTMSEVIDKLGDGNAQTRKDAAYSLSAGLEQYSLPLTMATNVLLKDKEIEDKWRKFPKPISARNIINQVEDEVVDALVNSVKGQYGNLTHRYYQLKAKWFGVEQLEYWDRNAPLPEVQEKAYTWDESVDIVMQAYREFSPELAKIGQKFFDGNWVDVPPKPGKTSGAFSHPCVTTDHPYILLNFLGKQRDVMTLAHELGHGIHQVLSAEQGYLLSDTPLTVAETASVFGEMMTFKSLLAAADSAEQRKVLLASKVEDMLNTVVRQIAFHEFEVAVHEKRRQGELTSDELAEVFLDTQKQALGPAVRLDPIVGCYWSYITHFIHTPFYVYAYAFGDCLVNTLYGVFESSHPDFVAKYIDLLRAGGSKTYNELLAPFDLDARDPQFWQLGLKVISSMIDELESL